VTDYLRDLAKRSTAGLEQLKKSGLVVETKPVIFSPHNLQIIERLT
jgi:hypothetical protein